MRLKLLEKNRRMMVRSAAVLLVGGAAAGCSSSVARFDGVDGIFTASTSNQRSILGPKNQAYPGDAQQAAQPAPVYSGSARSAVEPMPTSGGVQRSSLAAPTAATQMQVAPQPVQSAAIDARPSVDNTPTGTIARPMQPAPGVSGTPASSARGGWSRDGGTEVTVRSGETVYNLSKRYGVPVDAIVRANGLSGPDALAAGQKIVIPGFAYSNGAPVSAPDANPNVADAKSSRGTRYDVPSDKVPLPGRAPDKQVAVLPQAPKPRDGASAMLASPATTDPNSQAGAAPAPVQSSGGYTVSSGDSLYVISRKTGVPVEQIKAANNLSSPNLKIGQKLVIPAAGAPVQTAAKPALDPQKTAAVARSSASRDGDAPQGYTPPRQAEKVMQEAEETAAVAPDSTGISRMRWPVRGRVVSSYGSSGGSASDGIDIAVPEGTPVKAAENGVVIYAGNGLKEFGNTVLVRHEDGLVTVYGHASAITVNRGDKVKRGQEIAKSGMTGSADSPKLHFEVRKDSAPVDPAKFLE